MKKLGIKSWAFDDRPREKLISKGTTSLSSSELIAILIGSGSKNESAVDLSKKILKSVDDNLNELAKLSLEQLISFKGIGEAKAITIITALELGKRRHYQRNSNNTIIGCSKDAFMMMKPIIGDLSHEEFWILYLNNSSKVLGKLQISKGGITGSLVDLRVLFKRALELSSVAIVLCHNHPSGKTEPSQYDKDLTKKVEQAGKSLDIKLLDHLIITEKTYFSFADNGELR